MKLQAPSLTPEAFVKEWQSTSSSERALYQRHFIDVCRLVGAQPPKETDENGLTYMFEYGLKKTDGKQGYADVFYANHFAVEYKGRGKYKDLTDAYRQLQQYRENLNNPPLLIVCDIEHWEIHTNFTNAPATVIKFTHADIAKTHYQAILRRIFSDPNSFHPEKNKLQITEDVAAKFKDVVDETVQLNNDPQRIARFMTRLVFCMFVEDIGLLPKRAYDGILTEIIRTATRQRDLFPRYIKELFAAMATGGNVQMLDIHWFNGSMFSESDNDVIPLGYNALTALDAATDRDWAHVEPSIFGTIFERTLDEKKRGQLGAHYTHPDDILLIVEPVLMTPLRREWQATQEEAEPIRARYSSAPNAAARAAAEKELLAIRARILEQVRTIKVLDPACGSGNFLYISLRRLLDLEKEIITHPLWAGLPPETIKVHPTQLYGIEVNEIAHALASVVVWIGYLQWRQDNGFFEMREPILSTMRENIRRMDAIMTPEGTEPEWPEVDVIVGNPPFLGTKKMRGELGVKYVSQLHQLYEGRIPGFSDLVCYWFEKARAHLESGKVKRVGLLATNSIRLGKNRRVLERIKDTGDIFFAQSDRPWQLDGAAVRVSMVGFDDGTERERLLDDKPVEAITADLKNSQFVIKDAKQLPENANISFLGDVKGGSFDIPSSLAQEMLNGEPNPNGKSNALVLKPTANADDITGIWRDMWIIDFGVNMPLDEARQYIKPFEYIERVVKPEREKGKPTRSEWWLHMRPGVSMRQALAPLKRFIATPTVSKHRLFVWMTTDILPSHLLVAIAREDDYFFGVLHSRLHELWSLRMGTSLEDRPRYTPTTTFETFPFPFVPGKEDFTDPRVQAVSAAAKALHEERHAWLNEREGADSKDRTLTNLYNALDAHRGKATTKKLKPAAVAFAPRLAALHDALDAAVCAAYGWDAAILSDDEAMLRALLDLNAARAQ
jgi:hypothetical protein